MKLQHDLTLIIPLSPHPEFVLGDQEEIEVKAYHTIRSCWQLHQLVEHRYPLMEEEEQEQDKNRT